MADDTEFSKQPTLPGVTVASTNGTTTTPNQIGPYKVEGILDKGGMGYLYLAVHPETHDPLVIKVLLPKYLGHPELKAQFHKEAGIIKLANHPNIVKLYDHGEWEGGLYIAMEFVQGISLRQFILQHTMSLGRALTTIEQVATAIEHLHSHGVIHRDLKPENILVTQQGGIKVIDFGIAMVQANGEGKEAGDSRIIGTPVYMAPEQRQSALNASFSSDIYSLAIITYELVLGRLSHGDVHINLMPKGLQKILKQALQPEPKDRYQDISDFIADIREYLSSDAIEKDTLGRGYAQDLAEHVRRAQETLLPLRAPTWPKVEVGLATNSGLAVSGVYYDFLNLGQGKYGVVMSEPSSTGVEGIVHMAMVQGLFRALSGEFSDPDELIRRVNELVVAHTFEELFTLNYLILDTNASQIRYVSCGYGPLWRIRPGRNEPEVISSRNIAIGIDPEATFLTTSQNWKVGDTLVLNTLRVSDTGEFEKGLRELIHVPPQKQADGILRRALATLSGEPARRPITVMSIRRIA